MTDPILTSDELVAITGYSRPAEQLPELHRLGFVRARIDRLNRVVLERVHYDAVCDGRFAANAARAYDEHPKVARVR